jgi:hypothetical protein
LNARGDVFAADPRCRAVKGLPAAMPNARAAMRIRRGSHAAAARIVAISQLAWNFLGLLGAATGPSMVHVAFPMWRFAFPPTERSANAYIRGTNEMPQ